MEMRRPCSRTAQCNHNCNQTEPTVVLVGIAVCAATKEHTEGGSKIRPPELGWRELPRDGRRCRRRQKAFLSAYLSSWNIASAARATGIARRRHYHWLEHDADDRRAFDETEVELRDDVWDHAVEWARVGMPVPLFYKGKPTGHVIYRRSEKLMMLLLQILMPDRYGPSKMGAQPLMK